jgi:uncharacterized protein YggE
LYQRLPHCAYQFRCDEVVTINVRSIVLKSPVSGLSALYCVPHREQPFTQPELRTMKRSILILLLLAAGSLRAQTSGNQAYENNYRNNASKGTLVNYLTDSTFLVEAQVLMNVKADQFVAVFGVAEEGASVEEGDEKIDKRIAAFIAEVKSMGIPEGDIFVDMVTHNRIYDHRIEGSVAREYISGFELKKNVSIRYRDHQRIEKLVLVAAGHGIYDLVKVDYLVTDLEAPYNALMEKAQDVIARKKRRYEALTGVRAGTRAEIYLDDFRARYPSDGYRQYTAYEAGSVSSSYNSGMTVMNARKSRTFYFDSIDLAAFDAVINPVILEPVVQFTLDLAVRYEMGK